MGACDVCGGTDGRTFTVAMGAQTGTFDSFECAIHMMAPACENCGCRIIGHPADSESGVYCCIHCAKEAGNPHKPAKAQVSDLAVQAQSAPSPG